MVIQFNQFSNYCHGLFCIWIWIQLSCGFFRCWPGPIRPIVVHPRKGPRHRSHVVPLQRQILGLQITPRVVNVPRHLLTSAFSPLFRAHWVMLSTSLSRASHKLLFTIVGGCMAPFIYSRVWARLASSTRNFGENVLFLRRLGWEWWSLLCSSSLV